MGAAGNLHGTVLLKIALSKLVCASKEQIIRTCLVQQGITTRVCAPRNYYRMQRLTYTWMHLNKWYLERNDYAQLNGLAVTCTRFAAYWAQSESMDETLIKFAFLSLIQTTLSEGHLR